MTATLGKGGLYCRIRPSTSPAGKISGFLGLPGELRNRIYDYYFDQDFRVEIAAKGTALSHKAHHPKTVKLSLNLLDRGRTVHKDQMTSLQQTPKILRMPRRFGHYQRVNGIRTEWSSSLSALILVCRQVYHEAIIFLYQNTTYTFAAPRRIANFLDVIPKQNLSWVMKLHLHYGSYGCPLLAADRTWANKHLRSWILACKSASKQFINLQQLQVWIKVNEASPRFDLRQHWLQPLLQFRRLSCTSKAKPDSGRPKAFPTTTTTKPSGLLKRVEIEFRTYWSGRAHFSRESALSDASNHLHRLFAEAISLAILGASEDVAMAKFNSAWEDYSEWHHHLNYSKTDW